MAPYPKPKCLRGHELSLLCTFKWNCCAQFMR